MIKSLVEKKVLEKSKRKIRYTPTENINIVEVENFPELGKIAALRFLEWVSQNPDGVISLPTGKTPEYFIKWVHYFLSRWNDKGVQKMLEESGIPPGPKPEMHGLHFVQIDEFFPIDPNQKNSFYYYVKQFYINGFGLDPKKAMFISLDKMNLSYDEIENVFPNGSVDLTLRHRQAENSLELKQQNIIQTVDQFCTDYEDRIQQMGGIGFFLGGIGPDGHIAFNIRGSDLHSTTRLMPTNYETQAAAATDLGGIEVSRNRLVITIGLETISFNKNAVAIIIAAGEAKAQVVADAIQHKAKNLYPASILSTMPNAAFYLTTGAAKLLHERRLQDFRSHENIPSWKIEQAIIDLSVKQNKPIIHLDKEDMLSDPFTAEIQKRYKQKSTELLEQTHKSLVKKINNGVQEIKNKKFMHTAPHHDDIMLGYLPYIYHLVRIPENIHNFSYLTSGFTAVTNQYVLNLLENLQKHLSSSHFIELMDQGYFKPDNRAATDRDVSYFLDGIASRSQTLKNEAHARRILRDLVFLYEEESIAHLADRINELIDYFRTQYPGKKDLQHIQLLKGMIREWEADLLWAHFGFRSQSVKHLRLGFYKGDIFTEEPERNRDIQPILKMMEKVKPDVVTVAFDPEGSGPDTHYKVMQAIAGAILEYVEKGHKPPEVWGYRNVWFKFHPAEATDFVPVSLNSMAVLETTFLNSFGSQCTASFPSYELDGPFSRLAVKIQADQFKKMKICLGENFFDNNHHPRLRACHGLCYVKKMKVEEFIQHTRELKKKIESETNYGKLG